MGHVPTEATRFRETVPATPAATQPSVPTKRAGSGVATFVPRREKIVFAGTPLLVTGTPSTTAAVTSAPGKRGRLCVITANLCTSPSPAMESAERVLTVYGPRPGGTSPAA